MTTPATRKPFEKRYKTVVPVLRGDDREPLTELGGDDEDQDHAIVRWLGRESFERLAEDERLQLVEYSERIIPIDEVDPRLAEMLGRPVDAFDWFEFSGLGRLDQAAFDYFTAEIAWQTEEWLKAERAHWNAVDAAGGP